MQIGKEEGATVLTGGERLSDGDYAHGFFHQPTVFADATPTMRIAQEEIFGPVTTIIPVDSLDEAIEVANGVKYGLSASIYTHDVNGAFRAMRDLDTGIVYVNAPTIGAEIHLPFGGTKATGNGHREGGVQALDVFRNGNRCISTSQAHCNAPRSITLSKGTGDASWEHVEPLRWHLSEVI